MTQKLLPASYIIVPSKRQGQTVQVENGDVCSGAGIVVADRIRRGSKDYSSQLWLFDGRYFLAAKNPIYCIDFGPSARNRVLQLKFYKYYTIGITGAKGWWTVKNWGSIVSERKRVSWRWDLEGSTVVYKAPDSNRMHRNYKPSDRCYWRLEMVTSPVQRLGFGPFYRVRTCVIVPAHSLGKTVQLADGSTEKGTKIILANRAPIGQGNQLWIWDGSRFRSAKDPSKCLVATGGSSTRNPGYVELGVVEDYFGGRIARNRNKHWQYKARWVVIRNHATGLNLIRSKRFGRSSWVYGKHTGINRYDMHREAPITITAYISCWWKIEMVRGGPTGCNPPPRPDSRHSHHSHL